MNEEQIAEKLAELEPAWAGRPNLFDRQIAAHDTASLLARLDDPLPGVRADAIGLADYKSGVPYLLKAYRTEPPRVAAAIATALGRLGDRQALPWLLAALKAGLAPVEAATALGELGDAGATRGLCEALNHAFPPLRAAAARSLGQLARTGNFDFIMKDQAVTALHRLLGDADLRVQFCAALGLAGFGDPAGKQKLQQHLNSN